MGFVKKLILNACIFLFITGCMKTTDEQFSFPSSDFDPPLGSGQKMELSKVFIFPFIGYSGPTDILFDGTYIVIPVVSVNSNKITFNLLDQNLNAVTTYEAAANGAYRIFSSTSNGAGQIYALWTDSAGSTINFSVWPTISPGAATSSFVFNPASYGCDAGRKDFKISFYQNALYGVCTSSSSTTKNRLFSFNSSGTILSSLEIDSVDSTYWSITAMAILAGVINISQGSTNGVKSFNRFTTGFQSAGTSGLVTTYFPSNTISGFSSNGNSLFLNQGYEYCYPSGCYRLTKARMDGL